MKRFLHRIIKYIAAFVIIIFSELVLLTAVAVIPQASIQKHVHESATYFTSKPVFYQANKQDRSSIIDRYADSILMGIAYSYDEKEPLKSVLQSQYYHQDTANENDNLLAAVQNNLEPNYEYSRYWHGSIAIVRPMLTLLNIKQLYITLAVIMLLLGICLIFFSKKYINLKIVLGLVISSIAISIWYVPMSLEYVWNFLIMMTVSIFVILKFQKGRRDFALLFFATGSITAYFDFLTTETITLLIPLVLLLTMLEEHNELQNFKNGIRTTFFSILQWGIGYALTFLSKWTIASIVLQKNCFAQAISQAEYRIGGETTEVTYIQELLGALVQNISCLFPFSFLGKSGYGMAILTFFAILIIYYLFKDTKNSCYFSNLMFVIASIPYIRFLVLGNHSYLHHFFTYRAQMTTILCLWLALNYGIKSLKQRF